MTKKKSENYYKWKKEYYQKRRENKTSNRKKWCEQDITLLFEFIGTDSELSKVLNRSVQAIQVKRSKVIKFEANPPITNTYVTEAPIFGGEIGFTARYTFTDEVGIMETEGNAIIDEGDTIIDPANVERTEEI